ncbi:TRAP transporter small permease [Pontibacterium sp. N1Y112]|uniref:TRAP transporter small permease protein n=2 Tax=Pontibacterium sinense TaxID=2781979 RepID=A0A8J7FE39_9GAMM|nr:TRAP transporter small permease [Pontibacterium sinense]
MVGPAYVKAVPGDAKARQSLFFRIEARMAQVIAIAMVFATLALGLLMAAQVVMRYGLESPFLGIEELAPMLALWGYFLGMVYATRDQDHISGGIVALIFKNHTLIQVIRLAGSFACLLAVCVFGYFALKFAQFNLDLNRKSIYMRWPKYLWDFSMVSGFALMAFYYCLQIIAEIRDLKKGSDSSK